jgi:TPR repeat protein
VPQGFHEALNLYKRAVAKGHAGAAAMVDGRKAPGAPRDNALRSTDVRTFPADLRAAR